MKIRFTFLALFIFIFVSQNFAQNPQTRLNELFPPQVQNDEKLDKINENVEKLTKAVRDFTTDLRGFFEKFSSNQGLRLTQRQQTILMAFEILNRAEQRVSNLQKQKIELTERLASVRLQLARIKDDLLPESIDRYVSTRGTTNAEQVRELRRQSLNKEQNDLSKLVFDVENTLQKTDDEIRQTEFLIRDIRTRIFPQIEREISDL